MPASPSFPSGVTLSLSFSLGTAANSSTSDSPFTQRVTISRSHESPPPSLSAGTRGNRWKRRKREATQPSRRHKDAVEDDDEDEEPNDVDDELDRAEDADAEDANPSASNHNHAAADPSPKETEVLSDGGVRICDFPPVVKRAVNRPHSSVLDLVALERANSVGEDRDQVQGSVVCLENVSYGQLQALSTVPADSPGLADLEKGEGDSPSLVATPPSIMEGMGMMKRYGSRVHVVPMHSGPLSF